MTTFVLVHGAWHGGWCWERLVPLLQAAGHRVLAPDLPGMGADRTPFSERVLDDWADFVASLVRAEPEPVILVGHSRGGIVISEAAERAPDHVARLVYLTAFLLEDGQSLLNYTGAHPVEDLDAALNIAEDGLTCVFDPARAPGVFYGQCAPADAAAALARLCPEPLAAISAPIHVTPGRFGRIPRAYIEAADDRAIPLTLQRDMQSRLPCAPVITLESDHSPFYAVPERLAEALLSLA